MRPDPVHQETGAGVYWTTVNATEAIPGTATPLTWSFYDDATELALREAFALMGVLRRRDVALPTDRDARFIGIFHAHPAANLNRFRMMADLAPGGSGDALEQQFFGTVRSGVQPVRSVRRYPFVAARAPLVMRRAPRRLTALGAEADRWWQAAAHAPPDAARDRQLVRDGADLYRRILVWHGAATMITQGLYAQLGRLCVASGMPGEEIALVGGLAAVEERATLADIWSYAHGTLDRDTVVARHGFHGPDEGELSATVWREDPGPLDALAATFATLGEADAPQAKHARAVVAAEAARERLLAAAPVRARTRARLLVDLTRRLMPLREAGRGALVRAIDGTRAAARRLGDEAVTAGVLDTREDVFFLTIPELTGDVPARELVAARRERHATYLTTRLPEGWRGTPQPLPAAAPAGDDATALTGAAASAGVVEGVARVVLSPRDGDELVPGEILVCHTTDPGGAALMQLSAALVIDVGGPLSHGAIIARELGVPCVIGTRDGTARLRSGDRVSVDGTAGRVLILERSTAPA
ncbi:MAG TPA: PEP-utilizing enzyme [Solirubrobacteraceae bacterium]